MRSALTLALMLAAGSALAAQSLPMGNGYGAIDAPRDIDPLTMGQMFCAARLSGDMTPLQKFFAPKLVRLLAEKPAAAAIPWQTFPDRPVRCEPAIIGNTSNTIGVQVALTYVADAHQWTDTLNLERTPDSWLLNNVFYDGGGNLRFRLLTATP